MAVNRSGNVYLCGHVTPLAANWAKIAPSKGWVLIKAETSQTCYQCTWGPLNAKAPTTPQR